MPQINVLRRLFARQGAHDCDPVLNIIRQLESFSRFAGPTVAASFRFPDGGVMQWDWDGVVAERVGPAQGLQTLYRVRQVGGTATQRQTGPLDATLTRDFAISEKLLPLPAAIAEIERLGASLLARPGAHPGNILLDQPPVASVRGLLDQYYALRPPARPVLRVVSPAAT